MKTSKILAVAALSLVAVVGTAQAESYQGVTTVQSSLSRADVVQRAIEAGRQSERFYGETASNGIPAPVGLRDRAAVHAEAVAAAHNPYANLDSKAFVNSTIPSQYSNGSLAVRRAATRSASL